MENHITPDTVKAAAVRALVPLSQFLKDAGVGSSTFYRWEKDGDQLRPLTMERLKRAVHKACEGEKA